MVGIITSKKASYIRDLTYATEKLTYILFFQCFILVSVYPLQYVVVYPWRLQPGNKILI